MSKTFDADSHARFAAVSGDSNPMHMDPVAARRTQAGAPVVHGMHSLLWLLDCIAKTHHGLQSAAGLKASFRRVIYVGERVDAEILELSSSVLKARILAEGVEVVTASLSFGHRRDLAAPIAVAAGAPTAPPPTPIDLIWNQIAGREGRLSFATLPSEAASMFPDAARYLDTRRVAALACASCLVGMVVPGLHSLFGGLDISFCDDQVTTNELEYSVRVADERFHRVRIAVRAGGLFGFVDAFNRIPPIQQPSIESIIPLVSTAEFAAANALVIGGSRGLGALTAKLIAAGGGHVILTFATGRSDADAVAAEVRKAGGQCTVVHYDARQRAAPQLVDVAEAPTHVYYFATPTIYRRKAALFDSRRFAEFNAFYVTGFLDLVEACHQRRPQGMRVFYPSTVYLESRPAEMTEYAMSKAAGEVLCADMQTYLRGVRILARRLPRLATDQTSSLVPVRTADSLHVMLPIVREMHQSLQG
jgi:acyl dehydratase/NAD(P)-dependent dehydrogenase (short-subunit alcohol dehydrogenase family)